jgi:hypothetical protein
VHANVDAASQAFDTRIGDTANAVDGAAANLSKNEGISADMVSSIGAAATKPGADFAGAISGTVGDITSAFTSSVAGVTGDLASAVAAPLGALAGVVDFAVLADVANGDNGGIFDGIIGGDSNDESLASENDGSSDAKEIV